jgi:hypothetical protein
VSSTALSITREVYEAMATEQLLKLRAAYAIDVQARHPEPANGVFVRRLAVVDDVLKARGIVTNQ